MIYAAALAPAPHVVLLAGDEEYRSEEMMPQLARILEKNGFRCTVLLSQNAKGEIDPEATNNLPGLKALETADLCIMLLRFRSWPDEDMAHFVRYWESKKPIIALRTSTHAFRYAGNSTSKYRKFSFDSREWPGGFGKQVLGETWVSHWGNHGSQGTRTHAVASHAMLTGVGSIFVTTDVYEAHPPATAQVLLRGEVVDGMTATAPAATGLKGTALGTEQLLNSPMMPVLWVQDQIVTTTLGAGVDLLDPSLRRLLVNAAFWTTTGSVPSTVNADLVGPYEPSPFGFGRFRRGIRASRASNVD